MEEMEKEETKKKEIKTENTPTDNSLTEWAEKIYRASEETCKKLLRLRFLMDNHAQKEKFAEFMHEKQFGKFISVFKSESQLGLYIRIGGHEMATDYHPSRYHIEKIKNFLDEQGEKWLEVTQQIIMQLGAIPIVGRLVRRNILYPEVIGAEEEINRLKCELDRLKERLKEKDRQLRFSLDTWLYLAHGIESELRQANPCIYAMMNEIGKE